MDIRIRHATYQDAKKISRLFKAVSPSFTLDPEGRGAEGFFRTTSAQAICDYLANPLFQYLIAESENELAGAVAVKENRHLYHLFVAPEFQRKGIARELWTRAKAMALEAGNPGWFTVNSTPNAIPMYEKFGFVVSGARQEKNGIAVIPMRLELKSGPD